ncbi:hypothetical protein K4H03_24985, partial [Mycobacterium tuberculosis]|nr:hypothetical protein [Mycobacterium tuberculosis]
GGDSADTFMVAARTSGALGECDGIALFLVAADQVARRSFRMIDAHGAAEVVIDALSVGEDAVLGQGAPPPRGGVGGGRRPRAVGWLGGRARH